MFKPHNKFTGKETEIDIINDILNIVLNARPDSSFIKSLSNQYQERGSLSRKQLEGLYQKAAQCKVVAANKLATLQAVIMKKPNKYKSAPPPPKPVYSKDENVGRLIESILAKKPEHKRVLFFKLKYDNNETLATAEVAELERFNKLL